jgi:hypothetical protein
MGKAKPAKAAPTTPKNAKRAHARFAPSSAHRWMTCGGSITLCEKHGLVSKGSDFAREGTAAHKVHEICLKTDQSPDRYLGKRINVPDDEGRPTLVTVDAEMVEAVDMSLTIIRARRDDHGGTLYVESDVRIPVIGDDGHPDALVVDLVPELDVYDFKYGRGHAVDADGNDQMRLYAAGALAAMQARGIDGFDTIRCHIIQPRADHPQGPHRTEEISTADLSAYVDKVAAQIALIDTGNAPLVPSDAGCTFCPAKAVCPALARKAVESAGMDFADFLNPKPFFPDAPIAQIPPLSARDLGTALGRVHLLFMWAKAVRDEAMRRLAEGRKDAPTGYKLVEGKSNRRWIDPAATVRALVKLGLAIDKVAPRELVGIGDAQRMIPKAKRVPFMSKHAEKPPGKPTLAPATDPRPAVTVDDPAEVFAEHIESDE